MIGKLSFYRTIFIIFFFTFFLLFSFSFPNKLSADFGCYSYYTCHYQSGTGLTCPAPGRPDYEDYYPDPFQACACTYHDDGSCIKWTAQSCSSQAQCNYLISHYNSPDYLGNCPQYGDCCGCSGRRRLVPSPTPRPRPTPTPTVGVSQCGQPCSQTADCTKGLVCGYSQAQGRRTCQNPYCFDTPNCRCSWQK